MEYVDAFLLGCTYKYISIHLTDTAMNVYGDLYKTLRETLPSGTHRYPILLQRKANENFEKQRLNH